MASRMSDERLSQSIERTTKAVEQLDARKAKAQTTLDNLDAKRVEAETVLNGYDADRSELTARLDYLQTIRSNRPEVDTAEAVKAEAVVSDTEDGGLAPKPVADDPQA